MTVNIHHAKTHLSKLLRRVSGGEEIIIARAGVPVARLVCAEPKKGNRPLDLDRGLYEVPEDFDAPLPAEILVAFNGSETHAKRKRKGRTDRPR